VTITLWRIAPDARGHEAHDLSGWGTERSGGRWHRKGRPVVYAATSIALACLETIFRLNADGLPLNGFLVQIEIPDDVWATLDSRSEALPKGWSEVPEGRASMDLGDSWLKSRQSALLQVPSVIVPQECNVLINPAHPDTSYISAKKLRPWSYNQSLS
jgi:RES domain-containing protein